MNVSDIIFFGWYHILDKTIYSSKTERGGIGPKEHSFFITFLFHGINLWTILRYLTATYFNADVPIYLSLSVCILVFALGYLFYYKRKADRVIAYHVKNFRAILFVVIALTYTVISVYLLFEVGDYMRLQMSN